MNEALVLGLPTAAVSAALYGVAPLVQATAARREEAGTGLGLGLLARLVTRPLWLAGLAVEAGSFLLEVYALSVAPVALVAPVMALDMIVFMLLARRVLGERISRGGWVGVALMVMGIGLLAYAFERGAEVGRPAGTDVLFYFLVLGLVFTVTCAMAANRAVARSSAVGAAFGFGLAAGVSFAIATLATRQIGLAVDEQRSGGRSALVDLLTTPTPYLLVLFSVLAIGLGQRGLQGQGAVIAFPVTSGVSAFLPVTLGLTLFDEPAPGGAHLVAFVTSLVMVAAGIAALGRDRAAANRQLAEETPEEAEAGEEAAAETAAEPAGAAGRSITRSTAGAACRPGAGSAPDPGVGAGRLDTGPERPGYRAPGGTAAGPTEALGRPGGMPGGLSGGTPGGVSGGLSGGFSGGLSAEIPPERHGSGFGAVVDPLRSGAG